MLILSRRIDESIQIGDDITVTILEIRGTQVRIGIAAPEDVEVHREEIYERIHADKPSADHRVSDQIRPNRAIAKSSPAKVAIV